MQRLSTCRVEHTLSKSFTRLASIEELFSYSAQSSCISSAAKGCRIVYKKSYSGTEIIKYP